MLNFQTIASKMFMRIKCDSLVWLTSAKHFLVNKKVCTFIQYFVFNVTLGIKFPIIENSDVKNIKICIYLGKYCQDE